MKKLMLWMMVISLTIAPLRVSMASDESHCDMPAMDDAASITVSIIDSISESVAASDVVAMQAQDEGHCGGCCDTATSCNTTCSVACAAGSHVTAVLMTSTEVLLFEHVATLLQARDYLLSRELTPPIKPPASLTV